MPVPSSHGAQQPLGWRARLGALGSLGEERRRALYLFVRGAGRPVGRNEAADAVGLSRGTAAAHLDRLVDDGVLVATFAKPAGSGGPGSGRPSKFYAPAVQEVVAAVPQRSYELAGELLAAAAERSIAEGEPMAACIVAVGRAAGESLGRAHGSIGAVLEAAGYAPRSSADGGIDLSNCPFHRLSREYRGVVCSLNGALLNGALTGCGDEQHGIEPVDPDGPGHECCARVVPRP